MGGWQNPRPVAAEKDIADRRERELLTAVEIERMGEAAIPRRHPFRALLSAARHHRRLPPTTTDR